MEINTETIRLNKLYPFTISRGTRQHSDNVLVYINDGQHCGIGEFDASVIDDKPGANMNSAIQSIHDLANQHDLTTLSIVETWQLARTHGIPATALAALDMALWDLLGKRCGMPCYQLFGLSNQSVATSMTIGITPIDMIPERVEQLLGRHRFRHLKIKLGSKDGIEFDKEAFLAIKQAARRFKVSLRVDANGGWELDDAKTMCQWLANENVEYIEQPLAAGNDAQLPELFKNRPLAVFVDESCHFSQDIPRLAHSVDGINIKLMKCGGLTEAIRMVATARAHGLQTMIGCMSESSIAISAAASIGALFDHIDLDSHINLSPDPAKGAELINGAIIPNQQAGHGAQLC